MDGDCECSRTNVRLHNLKIYFSRWWSFITSANVLFSEALYEDEAFPERALAALVASKIYYHLQEYDESMIFALGAGKLFDIEHEGEFEDTIIGRCSRRVTIWDVVNTRLQPNA